MARIKYSTYEKFERGNFEEYLNSINIYNEDGNLEYVAKLSYRAYNPKWFDDFISDPKKDINRIMIYELQDGAKLMLRKYKVSNKVYMDTNVAVPVFGNIIHYSLIEVE